jgi:hypothetical protein
MARLTPQEFAEKHNRRTKGALEDMSTGIQKVSVAPSGLAVAKQAKMLANLTASVQNGTWANRLKAVDLQSWKDKMINKGIPRVSGGLDAAISKVQDFASQLLPAIDTAVAKVKAMPDLTIDDSINRMTTFVRDMSKFRKK